MLIKELRNMAMELEESSYSGPYRSEQEEHSVVRNVISNIELQLDHDARYKSYDIDKNARTVYWVTQQTDEHGSQDAADIIAQELAMNHIKDYTVKVVVRDLYRGNEDGKTPWQVAQTNAFMPDYDDDKQSIDTKMFKPIHDDEEFHDIDDSGRHTRINKNFNHEIGTVFWIQPDGKDMPISAVWYDDFNRGSRPLTMRITDLNDYIQADPYSPLKNQ